MSNTWLSVSPSYGRANKVNSFKAKVDNNTTNNTRQATIVVKTIDDLETKNILVEQENAVITMTSSNNQTAPAEIDITEDIHDFQITVRGNIKFNVYSDVEWIPLNVTNLEPNVDHVIDVHIEMNQTTERRVGHIVAYSKFFNVHEVFTINQHRSENIADLEEAVLQLVSNETLYCPTYKQSLTEEPILFIANTDVTLIANHDWITLGLTENGEFKSSIVVPRGDDDSQVKTVYVKCAANENIQTNIPNSDERIGSVSLSAEDEISVSVKQAGDREFVYWYQNMKFVDDNHQEIRPNYDDTTSNNNSGYETVKNILNSTYWLAIRCPVDWKVKGLPYFLSTVNVMRRQNVAGGEFSEDIGDSYEDVDAEILDSNRSFLANTLYLFNFKVIDVHSDLDTRTSDMVVVPFDNEDEKTFIMFTQNAGLGVEGFTILGGQGVGYFDNSDNTTADSWQKSLRELPICNSSITLLSKALTQKMNWTSDSEHDISEYYLYFRPVIVTGEYITPLEKNVKGTCVLKSTGKSIGSSVGTFSNQAKAIARYGGYYSSLMLKKNATTAIKELIVKYTYGNDEQSVIIQQLTDEKIIITPSDSSNYVNIGSSSIDSYSLTAVAEREYGLMLMKDDGAQIKTLSNTNNSSPLSIDLVVTIMKKNATATMYLENSYDGAVFYEADSPTEIFVGTQLEEGKSLTTNTSASDTSHTVFQPIKFTLSIPNRFLETIKGGTELATVRVEDDSGNEKTYTLYLTYNYKDFGSTYYLWSDTPSQRNDMVVIRHNNKFVNARNPIYLTSGIKYLNVDTSKVNIETNRYGRTIVKYVTSSLETTRREFTLTTGEYQAGGIFKGYFTISPDIDDITLKNIMETRMGRNTRVDVRATWGS